MRFAQKIHETHTKNTRNLHEKAHKTHTKKGTRNLH